MCCSNIYTLKLFGIYYIFLERDLLDQFSGQPGFQPVRMDMIVKEVN